MHYTEIESPEKLEAHLATGAGWNNLVVQGLDLSTRSNTLSDAVVRGTVFLGCRFAPGLSSSLVERGAMLFPELPHVPYSPYRGHLYSPDELMGDYTPGDPGSYADTLDGQVYQHFCDHGKAEPDSILETLARRLHDHSITDALHEFLPGKRVVAIMGGHAMGRNEPMYLEVAELARELTRKGFLMASGGGPGAMEATHLGAWFAQRKETELAEAVSTLAGAPTYRDKGWLDAAFAVRERFPLAAAAGGRTPESLGIPTWLYGHEPPALFATHIAKYFANSVREDGLLAIAKHGVIFSPGSAGTIQEIFQDACQNHYKTHGIASPMILFGSGYWRSTAPVFPLLSQLASGKDYARHLNITDDSSRVVSLVEEFALQHTTDGI